MERKAFGKVRAVAGFVLRFLSNPNTYLVVGAWIYMSTLDDAHYEGWPGIPITLLHYECWREAAADAKPALVLFGGMYAICRISRAIENLKAPSDSKAPLK